MAVQWEKTEFERFYFDLEGGPGYIPADDRRPGTGRAWWADVFKERISPLGIDPSSHTLLVGDGAGLLMEQFLSAGFSDVEGEDSSQHMSEVRDKHGKAHIKAKHSRRDATLASPGRRYDLIVTASVIESYPPEEQEGFYDALDGRLRPRGRVVHLLYPNVDMTRWPTFWDEPWAGEPLSSPGCPPRTMDEWRESRPSHTFLSLEGI